MLWHNQGNTCGLGIYAKASLPPLLPPHTPLQASGFGKDLGLVNRYKINMKYYVTFLTHKICLPWHIKYVTFLTQNMWLSWQEYMTYLTHKICDFLVMILFQFPLPPVLCSRWVKLLMSSLPLCQPMQHFLPVLTCVSNFIPVTH